MEFPRYSFSSKHHEMLLFRILLLLSVSTSFFIGCATTSPTMPTPPVFANLDISTISEDSPCINYDELAVVLGVKDLRSVKAIVEYSDNTRLSISFLDQSAMKLIEYKNPSASEDINPSKLINDLLGELQMQFGQVYSPSDISDDAQLNILIDMQVFLGSSSGTTTIVKIRNYYRDSSGRLLMFTEDTGIGIIPYPAFSYGLKDAKKMVISHIHNRFLGISHDEESELLAVNTRAEQIQQEVVARNAESMNQMVQAVSELVSVIADIQSDSSTPDNSKISAAPTSDRHSQAYYQDKYDHQKKLGLSILSSLLHRTVVEDKLYSATGGEAGSRPNAALNASLLRSFRSTQKLMTQIRLRAESEGYKLKRSDVETFNP